MFVNLSLFFGQFKPVFFLFCPLLAAFEMCKGVPPERLPPKAFSYVFMLFGSLLKSFEKKIGKSGDISLRKVQGVRVHCPKQLNPYDTHPLFVVPAK